MKKKKALYTTSEYLDRLKLQKDGNLYQPPDFCMFSNAGAAEHDAQWLVDFHKREGKKIRKPTVYRIRLEKVK